MLYRIILFIIVLHSALTMSFAQSLDAHYSFNACNLTDVTSTYGSAVANGSVAACDCGVTDDALGFNGGGAYTFPDLDMAFDEDFTLSFYFFSEGSSDVMDMLSISSDTCVSDSTMNITYSPVQKKVKIDILEHNSNRIHLEGFVDNNKCWHHVMIINEGNRYDLYVDEVRTETQTSARKIRFKPSARMRISGSPCLGTSLSGFVGSIDELKVWDYALGQKEINLNYLYPDKIISIDKTIFLGEQFQVVMGNVCTNSFNWSPKDGILNDGDVAPLIEPSESTTYIINVNNKNCKITDTINLYVIDSEDIDCNNVLLPKAFTPNNDGLNEDFGISNFFIVETLNSFEVYDRWANKVFETTDIYERWDGTFDGKKLNPGLFVYKTTYVCKTKTYNKTGSFSLIR